MSRIKVETRNNSSFFGQSHNREEELENKHIEEALLEIGNDALLAGQYSQGRQGPVRTGDQKQECTHKYHSECEQKKYYHISIKAFRPIIKTVSDFKRRPVKVLETDSNIYECILPVYLPKRFLFTGAVMVYHPNHGLLHTAIRHGSSWREVLSPNLFKGLPGDVLTMCERIEKAENDLLAKIEIEHLTDWLNTKSSPYSKILFDLQIAIYNFIQKHVTRDNYRGESCSTWGKFQMFWRIPGQSGKEEVLVTCWSKELYPPLDKLDNQSPPRPIRSIITAFFISNQDLDGKIKGKSVKNEY